MQRAPSNYNNNDVFHLEKEVQVHSVELPFFISKVEAGFPGPTSDNYDGKLDLNRHLISNPPATFFVRATGDSMIGAGIFPDDILIVDRSLEPTDGRIVIAVINGEMTVKRLQINRTTKNVVLLSENPKYPHFMITQDMDFSIWGIVTYVIHKA